jgi:predicted O-linked N-acetylglucosamine transferase (SPINDLY family)
MSAGTNNHIQENELLKLQSLFDAGGPEAGTALLKKISLLLSLKRQFECIETLTRAHQRYPSDDRWPATLASIWMNLGDLDQALAWSDVALTLNPDNETMFINRVCWLAARCNDPIQARVLFESWGQRFMDPLTAQASAPVQQNLARDRILKVGYMSGDLKNHSVRYFIEPILAGHDRKRIEVHAFMTMAEDEVSQFIKPSVDYWHNVSSLSDAQLLHLIRSQEIDILVDLSGHTEGQRLAVFAMRAAPVQVTWFGFMQTLGMKAMDWRLTDHGMSPEGTDAHFTEKLYRLRCMAAYSPPLNSETLYPAPYRENGFVTMISMNHSRKLGDQALSAWRDILLENPQSGLIVVGNDKNPEIAHASIAPRLSDAGLPMNRVSIAPRLTMLEFMGLASIADFALDSFPISGGTTTLHALWMGLPTLALNDPLHGGMSSSTAATLNGLGLNECVANNIEQYKAMASHWINNPKQIEQLRQRCRPALQNSVLMDHPARVEELETAFQFMWDSYLNSTGTSPVWAT